MMRMLPAIFVSCWVLLSRRFCTSVAMPTAERVRYLRSSVSSESRLMSMRNQCETSSGSSATMTIAPSSVQRSRGPRGVVVGMSDIRKLILTCVVRAVNRDHVRLGAEVVEDEHLVPVASRRDADHDVAVLRLQLIDA